jgi:hypothetical protein
MMRAQMNLALITPCSLSARQVDVSPLEGSVWGRIMREKRERLNDVMDTVVGPILAKQEAKLGATNLCKEKSSIIIIVVVSISISITITTTIMLSSPILLLLHVHLPFPDPPRPAPPPCSAAAVPMMRRAYGIIQSRQLKDDLVMLCCNVTSIGMVVILMLPSLGIVIILIILAMWQCR